MATRIVKQQNIFSLLSLMRFQEPHPTPFLDLHALQPSRQKHTSKGACRVYWFKSAFILSECAHFVCWYNKNNSNYYCWVWYVCILNCISLLHTTDGETVENMGLKCWEPEFEPQLLWRGVDYLSGTHLTTLREKKKARIHITSATAAFPNFL